MKNKDNTSVIIGIALIAAIAVIGIASASTFRNTNNDMMGSNMMGSGMASMMSSMGMSDFKHDVDDIEFMRKEMKEHMNMTNEEFNEMASHCPMMG